MVMRGGFVAIRDRSSIITTLYKEQTIQPIYGMTTVKILREKKETKGSETTTPSFKSKI